jgi:hypothetical protein
MQGIETQCFPTSKEIPDMEITKRGIGISLLGHILLVDYLEKSGTITAMYYVAFIDKMKQQLVYKRRSKL